MATIDSSVRAETAAATLGQRWGWLLALGIVQLVAGALAIAVPVVASLAAVIVFGAALIATAVFHLIHAVKERRWPGSAWYVLGGLLYAAAGVWVLLFPLGGVLTLGVLIATLLIAEGTLRSLLATALRPRAGWGWLLAGGIASIMLGILLFTGWPATALWAVGLLLGINLLFSGATNIALAFAFRKRSSPAAAHTGRFAAQSGS